MTDRPLNVAIVHTSDQGGGAEASSLSLHRSLLRLGHHSRLFVGRKKTCSEGVFEISRFRCFPGVLRIVQTLERKLGWQYIYQPWFNRLDKMIGPDVDVVHYQSLWAGRDGYASVGSLPRLTSIYPSLLTLRDMWMLTGHCALPALGCERWKTGCGNCPDLTLAPAIDADGTRFNWRNKQRALSRSRLRITTVSNWLGGIASQSPILAGKSVYTVYNGIDSDVFYPRDRMEMRRKWNLPVSDYIVLIAGQSVEGTSGRGQGATQFALAAAASSNTQPFLLVIGRSAPAVLSQWQGTGRAIEFQNEPALLAELYCAADVVLVASLWETFGRIPAEAQMCGIPVASFATGGIPEIVEHNVTGLISERMNGPALGQSLKTLYEQPELRKQYGAAGAQRANQLFGDLTIARNYIEHYRSEIALRQPGKAEGASR